MTNTSNEEFARRMVLLSRPAEQFVPTATYDRDGDCIEFLAKPDPFFAERVDDLVTVYFSQQTGDVIGSLIKGVSRFCRRILDQMPGFQIEIQAGRIRLVHIFLARLWGLEREVPELAKLTYRKLIDVAEESGVEVDGQLVPA